MRHRLFQIVYAYAIAIAAVACTCMLLPRSLSGAPAVIEVSVGIPPMAFLVERIGADHVSVDVLLISGQDPHTFEPTPRQVVDLVSADLYFSVGLPFEERLLAKIRNSGAPLVIVDTTEIEAKTEPHSDLVHGHEDPHVWLSPPRLSAQARVIAGALSSLDPERSGEYERNLSQLCREIDELDQRIRQMLAPYGGREFLVYHSALEHFAAEYGLTQIAVEAEGKSPGAKALAGIIERARSSGIRIVFVQPQFDDSSARVIAEAVGAATMRVDPLEKDVLSNLWFIAEQLVEAMR